MSLILPDIFKKQALEENWIFCLGYNESFDTTGSSNKLNELLLDDETDVDVDDGSAFVAGDFIKINREVMLVESVSSNTLTVERGINYLTESHSNNDQIFFDNFTPISFADTQFEGRFSNGAVTSSPSIRESINIEECSSKTSNISITLANFTYEGKPFSEELFGHSTRTYINRTCKVFIQIENQRSINKALLVYTGRLVDFSHSLDTISLSIVARNPMDNVEVPQVKTDKENYYPIAYGDYTANASASNSESVALSFGSGANIDEFRKRKTLYPIPVEERRGDTIFSLTGLRSITQNAYPHFYEKSSDTFLPIANHASTASTVDVDNESFGDAFAVRCHQNLLKGQFIKPVERTSSGSSTALTWASNNNAFNGDYIETSTFTECTIDGNFTADESATIKFKMPQLTGTADQISIHLVLSGSVQLSSASGVGGGAEIRVQLIDESFGANDVLGYYSFTDNATSTTFNQTLGGTLNTGSAAFFSNGNDSASEYHSSSAGWGEEIKLKVKLVQQSGSLDGNLTGHIRIHDIVIQVDSILDYSDQDKKANSYKIIDDIDTLYCGANGLKDVNSWGGDALITKGVFAYRDLLQRFVNFTDGRNVPYDSSFHPDNWSSGTNISTVKDWAIRYWITEPKLLVECLEEIQKNFGFIGRYNSQGDFIFIYIPDSISTDHTLTKDDIADINISLTPFDSIVTSMDIEYEKHPVNGQGYESRVEASNSTNITAYNIASNEKKKTVRLDALVSAPASSPSSNPNDDYFTYFNNLVSDIKTIVSFTVVNPIYYIMEVGDFVAFGDVDTNAFASSFSGKDFIVTQINRKIGTLSVTVREV